MAELVNTGGIVYPIIALMVVEFAALAFLYKKTRRTLPWFELLCNLGAGAALLFALRGALTGAAWTTIAAPLSVALVAHVLNMRSRWQVQR